MLGWLRDSPAPTARLFVLALLLVPLLALGEVAPAFLGAAAAAALALLGVVVVDHGAAARSRDLTVERLHHPRLYLGADNAINLAVRNSARREVEVRLRDTP